MRTFKIISFYTLIAIPQFFFFIPYIILADEWGLDNQSLKYEWGLEEQTVKHEKSDSIVLYYNGKAWDCIYNGHGIWLNSIYGFDWNDIFAVGDNGVILHYDGKSWAKQESNVTYRLNRIWGSCRDNVYVSGDYGAILHYNGEKWTKYNLMTNQLAQQYVGT